MVRITKAIARERLADVSPDKQFWCCDGRILKNLSELVTALQEINGEAFRYHSNEAKNDFVNWVRDVIGDDKLTRDLAKSRTQALAARAVAARVAWLKNRAGAD